MGLKLRGFTLVEICVTMVVVAIVLGMAMFRIGASPSGSVREAASRLVEEMKLARSAAISSGQPVAFCIPDGPDSGTFYLVAGRANPHLTMQTNISVDHRGVHMCPVHWLGVGNVPASTVPVPMETDNFNWASWNHPAPADYQIVFLPSGAVLCNKVSFDGDYHFIVALGATSNPASVGTVASHLLTSATQPYTITIKPTGHISATKGVVGVPTMPSGGVFGTGPETVPAKPPNTDPYDLVCEVFPPPNANVVAMGFDATVDEDGFLTLRASAIDDQADQLNCVWTCSGNDGEFSYDQEIEMEWDGTSGRWESIWEWYPPVPDTKGIYILTCEVKDGNGGSVTGTFPVGGVVSVSHEGRIVYSSDELTLNGLSDIYTAKPDGTDVVNLTNTPTVNDHSPVWTLDGLKIVYVSNELGAQQIWIMDEQGDNKSQISTLDGRNKEFPNMSIDGTKVYFHTWDPPAAQDIRSVNLDGTGETVIYTTTGGINKIAGVNEVPGVLGGPSHLLYSAGTATVAQPSPLDQEIYSVPSTGGVATRLTTTTQCTAEPNVSRIHGKVAFHSFLNGPTSLSIATYDPNGPSLSLENNFLMPQAESPRWSPTNANELVTNQLSGYIPGPPSLYDKDIWIVDSVSGTPVREMLNVGAAEVDGGHWKP